MSRPNTSQQEKVVKALYLIGACWLILACKDKGSNQAKEMPPESPPNVVAEQAPVPAEPPSKVVEEMQGHFAAIRSIERAIVAGDVESAKNLADTLANMSSNEQIVGDEEEMQAVRVAARVLTETTTLEAAAMAAASLAGACGQCHLQTTSISSFEWQAAPLADGSAKERMQRHQWAMDRLWEGLVGPAELAWQGGSEVLTAAPFPAQALPVDEASLAKSKSLLADIERLGKQAPAAAELSDRIQIYGELLSTCSACHDMTWKRTETPPP